MNVLLSAVGRRAYLVEYFKQVVHPLGGKVYVTNTTPEATGYMTADEKCVVPPSASPEYVPTLLRLCKEWKIRLLFSLHDWDAPVIARARQQFDAIGTTLVMGSPELMACCLDKYATVLKAEELGVPVPKTVLSLDEARALTYPLIVKPRWGQGSIGLFRVDNEQELASAYSLSILSARKFAKACPEIDLSQPQVIIQECVEGTEYGCDIINDLKGGFRGAFVKQKFGMRSGETDVAESVTKSEISGYAEIIANWSRHLGCMDSDWIIGREGTPRLIELNPRFGGGYPFTHCAGVNVPLACVNWARGVDNNSWCKEFKIGVRTYKKIALVVKDTKSDL